MAQILCVDDDRQVVQLKKTILEKAGHRVDTSLSVEDALTKLRENAYDAIITDWWFGQSNSLRLVREAKGCQKIPVVVVSGFVADALVSLGSAADIYLHKPVGAQELTTVLEDVIRNARRDTPEDATESAA